VSFTCLVQRNIGRPSHAKAGAHVVGLDAGVKDLIVLATPDGTEIARIPAPAQLKQARRVLRALQRKAARQTGPRDTTAQRPQEPSKGWERTQADLRKAHARVASLRLDRMHKLTTQLAQAHTVIGVETLAVKNMMASGGAGKRGLNRAMANASLGRLFRQIDYKAAWYGAHVVKAGRWHPSSKTCSGCGAVKAKLALAERTFKCTGCGLVIDRDHNAAVNLARYALAATDPSAGFGTGGADRKTTASAALVAVKPGPETEQDIPRDGGSGPPEGVAA
jgi:putative transposase